MVDNRKYADEAARWFVRLQDASTHAEMFVEWQCWLNAAPEHRRAYEEIEETILRMRRIPSPPPPPTPEELAADAYDGSMPIREFLEQPRPLPARAASAGRKLHFALAAGLAAFCVLCAWLWLAAESRFGQFTYATLPGERQVFTLPDGSKITLDADSVLGVDLTSTERVLRLERGEAYFQVAKDRARPFIVYAGGARVRAVGTAFNVRMGASRTVVAVVEGKVEVTSKSSPAEQTALGHSRAPPGTETPARPDAVSVQLFAQLGAGEAVVAYASDGKMDVLPTQAASIATSWLEGRRQYRNEPLRYVLADVDRYTEQRIEIADAATGDLKFTGTLILQNSDAWLKGLSIALPVTTVVREDGTLLVKLRESGRASAAP